jgi:hypothetical protein
MNNLLKPRRPDAIAVLHTCFTTYILLAVELQGPVHHTNTVWYTIEIYEPAKEREKFTKYTAFFCKIKSANYKDSHYPFFVEYP